MSAPKTTVFDINTSCSTGYTKHIYTSQWVQQNDDEFNDDDGNNYNNDYCKTANTRRVSYTSQESESDVLIQVKSQIEAGSLM